MLIAAIIAAATGVWGVVRSEPERRRRARERNAHEKQAAERTRKLAQLFTPEYQPSQVATASRHETNASPDAQRVHVTLRLALDTHVEFVAIRFDGAGTLPRIGGLDDWQWEQGKPPGIHAYSVKTDGRWYWQYETPHHRFENSRITIGMDYLATDYFDGFLVFEMTAVDGKQTHKLPFHVRKLAG